MFSMSWRHVCVCDCRCFVQLVKQSTAWSLKRKPLGGSVVPLFGSNVRTEDRETAFTFTVTCVNTASHSLLLDDTKAGT